MPIEPMQLGCHVVPRACPCATALKAPGIVALVSQEPDASGQRLSLVLAIALTAGVALLLFLVVATFTGE